MTALLLVIVLSAPVPQQRTTRVCTPVITLKLYGEVCGVETFPDTSWKLLKICRNGQLFAHAYVDGRCVLDVWTL